MSKYRKREQSMASEMDGVSKGLLGAFVLFAFGSGLATLIYGIRTLLQYLGVEYYYGLLNLFNLSIVLIILGGLLIIAVVLGVFGALKDVPKVRMVALGLMFIVLLSFVLIGSYTMFMWKTGRLQQSIEKDLGSVSANYYTLSTELQAKPDYINQKFNCCITYAAPSDYPSRRNEDLPDSCKYSDPLDTSNNMQKKTFERNCTEAYTSVKSAAVFQLSVVTLANAGATFIGLVLYGIISQRRTHAGYAGVSRG